MLEKPPYGAPCNSCGKCCQDELCRLGLKIFGPLDGPCPALTRTNTEADNSFGCGLILTPQRFAPKATQTYGAQAMSAAAALLCAAGAGCDAIAPGEAVDPGLREKLISMTEAHPPQEIAQARDLWIADEDLKAAWALVGKPICFAHEPDGPVHRVETVVCNGMVTIDGIPGEYGAHLFLVVNNREEG
jgi:hypothetical protein